MYYEMIIQCLLRAIGPVITVIMTILVRAQSLCMSRNCRLMGFVM